jgi:hypothetical protein
VQFFWIEGADERKPVAFSVVGGFGDARAPGPGGPPDPDLPMPDAVPAGQLMRFFQLFAHPRALPAIAVLAALLVLQSALRGFSADDYILIAELEHNIPSWAHTSPLDLYRFAPVIPPNFPLDSGWPVPWFSNPSYKLHFCRPLTGHLITLDHSLRCHNAR